MYKNFICFIPIEFTKDSIRDDKKERKKKEKKTVNLEPKY